MHSATVQWQLIGSKCYWTLKNQPISTCKPIIMIFNFIIIFMQHIPNTYTKYKYNQAKRKARQHYWLAHIANMLPLIFIIYFAGLLISPRTLQKPCNITSLEYILPTHSFITIFCSGKISKTVRDREIIHNVYLK